MGYKEKHPRKIYSSLNSDACVQLESITLFIKELAVKGRSNREGKQYSKNLWWKKTWNIGGVEANSV